MTTITNYNNCNADGLRALIVDDELAVGSIMAAILELAGFAVDCAHDGNEALDLCGRNEYAAVVCDLLMPGMNGMTLFRIWRERYPHLAERTLFVTGDCVDKTTARFIASSGRPCIYKPFSLHELTAAVQKQAQAS